MRIDLAHDRVDHHPSMYRDPVVEREGVFAHMGEDELSLAEQQRLQKAETRSHGLDNQKKSGPIWSPQQILDRLTKLYQRFRPTPKENK